MSTTDEKRPKARSGQRSGKAKQAGPKADQRQRAKPVQAETIIVEPAVSLSEIVPVEAVAVLNPVDIKPDAARAEPLTNAVVVAVSAAPVIVAAPVVVASPVVVAGPVVGPVETFWIGFHTIAAAYTACAWRSLEETIGLVEKLTLAPSLEKTIEVQNDFARKTCDGVVADSQKIWRLYGEVSRQIYRSFERFLVWRPTVAR
jgi:phasin protein